jgi:hypothetical protein
MYQLIYDSYVLCTDEKWRHQGFADNPKMFENQLAAFKAAMILSEKLDKEISIDKV